MNMMTCHIYYHKWITICKFMIYIFSKYFPFVVTYLTRHHFHSYPSPTNQKSLFLPSPNFSCQDCKSSGLSAKGRFPMLCKGFISHAVKRVYCQQVPESVHHQIFLTQLIFIQFSTQLLFYNTFLYTNR